MTKMAKAKRLIALNLAILLLLAFVPIGALATISGVTFPFHMHIWGTSGQQIVVDTPGEYTFRVEAQTAWERPLGPQWLVVRNAAGTAIAPTNIVHHNELTSDITFDLQAGPHTLASAYLGDWNWNYATGAVLRLWEDGVEPASPWVVILEPGAVIDGIGSGSGWVRGLDLSFRPAPGETVQATAWPARGFEFVRWEVLSGGVSLSDENASATTFVMPDEDVVVQPVFVRMADAMRVDVSVNNPEWGSVSHNFPRLALPGDQIWLSATPSNLWPWHSQYWDNWGHWEVVSGDVTIDDPTSRQTTFIMPDPAVDVEIQAVFAFVPASSISIHPAGNFQLGVNATRQLSATITPEDATNQRAGWWSNNTAVATVDADGLVRGVSPGTATITAWVANEDVSTSLTVTVVANQGGGGGFFPPVNDDDDDDDDDDNNNQGGYHPFNDVSIDNWFHGAVQFVYENDIMQGTGANTFSPNATLSRGMVATILHRLAGEPTDSAAHDFGDVAANRWYSDAVAWAFENGIVQGTTSDRFAPNAPITREQFATMLHRYAEFAELTMDVSEGASLDSFVDAYRIGDWAEDAKLWANYHGLITGRTPTTIVPNGTATRAEAATILMRLVETF